MIRWQWVTMFWFAFFPRLVLFHWLVLLSMKCNWGRSVNLFLKWYLVIVCLPRLLFCLFCLFWFLVSFIENSKPGDFLYLYIWCLNPRLQQRRQFLWEKTDIITFSTSIQELPHGKPKYTVSNVLLYFFLSLSSMLPLYYLSSPFLPPFMLFPYSCPSPQLQGFWLSVIISGSTFRAWYWDMKSI